MPVEIIPSLLTQSEEEFLHQYNAVKHSVSCIQIDIADGEFVPNKTWADPGIIKDQVEIDIELHLMVMHPREEMERWKHVRQVKRALVHYESIYNSVNKTLAVIEGYCWQKSLVLNPDTPIQVIDAYADQLFGIMFMGVNPGFQGQKLIPSVIKNISIIKKKYPHLFLEIDGGVNEQTIPDLMRAGVDAICPGSAIFKNDRTPKENVERIQNQMIQLTKTKLGFSIKES